MHPAQSSDDAATSYHRHLGYHIGDWVTATIEGNGDSRLQDEGNALEGTMKYCGKDVVNLKSVVTLVGMTERFTMAWLRPLQWATPPMATSSWGRTASGEIRGVRFGFEVTRHGDEMTRMIPKPMLMEHAETVETIPARVVTERGIGQTTIRSPALTSRRLLWPTRACILGGAIP